MKDDCEARAPNRRGDGLAYHRTMRVIAVFAGLGLVIEVAAAWHWSTMVVYGALSLVYAVRSLSSFLAAKKACVTPPSSIQKAAFAHHFIDAGPWTRFARTTAEVLRSAGRSLVWPFWLARRAADDRGDDGSLTRSAARRRLSPTYVADELLLAIPAIGVIGTARLELPEARWLAVAVVASLLSVLLADLFSPGRLLESHLRSDTNYRLTFALRSVLRFLAVVATFTAFAIACGASVTIDTVIDQARGVFIGSITGLVRGLVHTGNLATTNGWIRLAQLVAALAFYVTVLRALRGILLRKRSITDQLGIARDLLLAKEYDRAETYLGNVTEGDRNGEWASLRAVLVLKQNNDLAGAATYLAAAAQLADTPRPSSWLQLFQHARSFELDAQALVQLVLAWSRLPPDQLDEGEIAGAVRTQMMIDPPFGNALLPHLSELPVIARSLAVVHLDPAQAAGAAADLRSAALTTSPLGVLVAWSVIPVAVRRIEKTVLVLTETDLAAIERAANQLPSHQVLFGLSDVASMAMFAEIPPTLAVRYDGVISDLEARLPESERRLFERGRRLAAEMVNGAR